MESDGRIRSKDIGTGEVNSRVIDDLRSSNYDGSRTDPENDPGLNGWQILKNGFVVINNAVVRGTISAARIISAVIESGTVRLSSGGKIELGGDPDTGTPATAVLSETGIDIQSGKVVLDSTGLEVDGGQVQGVWAHAEGANQEDILIEDDLITSSASNVNSITIDPPTWVEQLYVYATCDFYVGNSTGAPHRMDTMIRMDDGGVEQSFLNFSQEKEAGGISRAVSISDARNIPLSPAGRAVVVTQRATLSSGSSSDNHVALNVMAVGLRNAFV